MAGKRFAALRGPSLKATKRQASLRARSAKLCHLRAYARGSAVSLLTVGVRSVATYAALVIGLPLGQRLNFMREALRFVWPRGEGRSASTVIAAITFHQEPGLALVHPRRG